MLPGRIRPVIGLALCPYLAYPRPYAWFGPCRPWHGIETRVRPGYASRGASGKEKRHEIA